MMYDLVAAIVGCLTVLVVMLGFIGIPAYECIKYCCTDFTKDGYEDNNSMP